MPQSSPFDFLGGAIESHAILMVFVWFVLVPICILAIRFGKPRPRPKGIRDEIRLSNPKWWWFSTHKFGFYVAIGLSIVGGAIAWIANQGYSGSVHAVFGILTITLGVVQVASSWFRGKHGGKYYFTADPDDPKTWFGDHYNMTPRRRFFEAFHRYVGYFSVFCAAGALASGLMQYPIAMLFGFVVAAAILAIGLSILFEYKGLRHDGYRAAFGNDPEHPYNIARKDL